jgi:hypothetical protein
MKKVHNYTSNLELTSLLIRIKNYRALSENDEDRKLKAIDYINNRRLNKYIRIHTKLNDTKSTPENASKRFKLKDKLKKKVISLSEVTPCDKFSYNRFGDIILLMIKKILTRPQFSGYTYKDDFFSDASFKILKYLGNFDHTMISERTGQSVNAFSYITQIIMNSIICIINNRKRENDKIEDSIKLGIVDNYNSAKNVKNLYILDKEYTPEPEKISKFCFLDGTSEDIVDEISKRLETAKEDGNVKEIKFSLRKENVLSIDDYNHIKILFREFSELNPCFDKRYEEMPEDMTPVEQEA